MKTATSMITIPCSWLRRFPRRVFVGTLVCKSIAPLHLVVGCRIFGQRRFCRIARARNQQLNHTIELPMIWISDRNFCSDCYGERGGRGFTFGPSAYP